MKNTKASLATLWQDKMTVYEVQAQTTASGATTFAHVIKYTDEPCKLSYSSLSSVEQKDDVADVKQTVKIFCDVALDLKAGCYIDVIRNGATLNFKHSGQSGKFSSHQEIYLIPIERFA